MCMLTFRPMRYHSSLNLKPDTMHHALFLHQAKLSQGADPNSKDDGRFVLRLGSRRRQARLTAYTTQAVCLGGGRIEVMFAARTTPQSRPTKVFRSTRSPRKHHQPIRRIFSGICWLAMPTGASALVVRMFVPKPHGGPLLYCTCLSVFRHQAPCQE